MAQRIQIMSPDRIQRTLSRLAYEIIERNRGAASIEVVGIRQRGTVLAHALAATIGRIEGREMVAHELDVTGYRDDRDRSQPIQDASRITADISGRDVILIDDVLFTGRTARAALDALIQYGRPKSIQLAVLIDRGHREYPIQPDYVGRFLQTKHKEHVVVDVTAGYAVYIEE